MRRVRGGPPVPPVQRAPDLPRRQRAADVPLLRPLGAGLPGLPGVRRHHEADRRGDPAGGGGAPRALSGDGGAAYGRGHRVRQPRGAAAEIRAEADPHTPGHPDGGQGAGF